MLLFCHNSQETDQIVLAGVRDGGEVIKSYCYVIISTLILLFLTHYQGWTGHRAYQVFARWAACDFSYLWANGVLFLLIF